MKMLVDQRGIAHMVILLVVALAAIGTVGYFTWTAYQARQNVSRPEVAAEEKVEKDRILDLGENYVSLTNVEDLEQLPNDTSQTFVTYLNGVLDTNRPLGDSNCITEYVVSKISDVNVKGSVRSIDADNPESSECGGGAAVVWSLVADKWRETGFQSVLLCSVLVKNNIYSEFISECYDGEDSNAKIVDNPNGALTNQGSGT